MTDIKELGEQVAVALHSSGGPTDEILATWVVAVSDLLTRRNTPVEPNSVDCEMPPVQSEAKESKPAVKHAAKLPHRLHKTPARHR